MHENKNIFIPTFTNKKQICHNGIHLKYQHARKHSQINLKFIIFKFDWIE